MSAADPAPALPDPTWWVPGLATPERPATAVPRWAEVTEAAVCAAEPLHGAVDTSWRAAFGRILRPFVTLACGHLPDDTPDTVRAALAATLTDKLVAQSARALVSELHRHRAEGTLAGTDGRARFQDFVRRLTEPKHLGELMAAYPVLARLLAQTAIATSDSATELLTRWTADRDDVVTELLDGVDPGPLTGLTLGQGDAHGGGRTVAFLDFAGGARVVYKPRDCATQLRFADFVTALDAAAPGLAPRVPRVLTRAGYGWSEFIPAAPLPDEDAADRFYRRQGALLALLHAVRATDVHHQNVIAHGEHPVLVDTETVFHPDLTTGTGDPAADALAASVYRTALLPMIVVGEEGAADLSGLGGGHGGRSPASVVDWIDTGTDRMRMTRRPHDLTGAGNRPRLRGADVEPADHETAMLTGFRLAYDAIAANRAQFTALAESCADLEIRVITRPTWIYATLLDETTHPDVLRDAADRDNALSVLRADRDPTVARHELADLWAGDIPLFRSTVGGTTLRTAHGAELPIPLPRSSVDTVRTTIAGLSEVDRRDQEWIISATLATRRGAPAHPVADTALGTAPAALHPDDLLAAACAVADQLVARGVPARGRVNWLGLESVDDRQWLVLPLGASLGTGHLGVALFLAQLTATTGITRYADLAHHAVAELPALIDTLTERPDLVSAIGCGGMHGLGGIAYGLARLALLLNAPALRTAAAKAVTLAAIAAAESTDPGWSTGLAGCLAALDAVATELGNLPTATPPTTRATSSLTAGPAAGLTAGPVTSPATTPATGPLTGPAASPATGPAAGLTGGPAAGPATGSAATPSPTPDRPTTPATPAPLDLSSASHIAPEAAIRACADRLLHLATDAPDPLTAWALHHFGPDDHHRAAGTRLAATALAETPDPDLPAGWCHGLAGRLLARTALPEPIPDTEIADLAAAPVRLDLSLCHGELGITEVLAAVADGPNSPAARAVRRRGGLALDTLRRHGPRCGVPGGVPTPGLLTGLAGIGYAMLRLAAPAQVPSALLLRPTP
ncbi:type 2 lanthipeptide synthetase LanM family protein [Actinokineospora sp. HUAS TT18]|uniref:type 2 lanthipeptide synthetase LanM family protein n=1 Tax=Actinokineospora sp. HUAS TT18 TaxID=3447451 RepID=UPI003F51CAEC